MEFRILLDDRIIKAIAFAESKARFYNTDQRNIKELQRTDLEYIYKDAYEQGMKTALSLIVEMSESNTEGGVQC